jgi:ABC-type branched-subunit amino acid transport system ATPase component
VVEQNVTFLKGLAKNLCLIENGTFVLQGCVQDVLGHGDVEKAYLGAEKKED